MNQKMLDLFYKHGLPPVENLRRMMSQYMKDETDFIEIYVQNSISRVYRLSERLISAITTAYITGAGIRVIKGSNTGFSFTEDLSEKNTPK